MASMMRFAASSLVSRVSAPRNLFSAVAPRVMPVQRRVVQVRAEEEGEKKKGMVYGKRTDPAVKRAQLAVTRRLYNKSRKSACATRIKKVLVMADGMMNALPSTEDEVKPLEKLISEAFKEIDKAIVKGVIHKNTGARKKARVSRHKRKVLMAAGLFVPAADHPSYKQYVTLYQKAVSA
eukprot:gene15938-22070_t